MSRPFFLFYIIKSVYNYIKNIGGLSMQNIVYFTSLINRIDKSSLDSQMATFLKGLEGEAIIYQKLKLINHLPFLYNIELNINNRVQIDFLVVSDDYVYHFEIKNYSGDYYIKNDQFINDYGSMFYTPFQQLYRANNELQLLLKKCEINREIKTILIFTNPTFTLKSQIPPQYEVLLPTELHKIQRLFKNYKIAENHRILKIIEEEKNTFSDIYQNNKRVPFDDIKHGLKCPYCKSVDKLNISEKKKSVCCTICSNKFSRRSIYLYNLKELFICKGEPFTLQDAERWCSTNNKHTLRRICNKYFEIIEGKPRKYYLKL